MRRVNKRWAGMALVLMLASTAAIAGVKDGVTAWQAGDYPKAVSEWRGPADAGDPDAQFNLGQAYKLGRGVPLDTKIAEDWYLKAARQGHEQAQANLGLILFQNGDRDGAVPWIRKAADRGEPRAQYVLATAMFNGDLVPRDWPRAYALMTRAAAAGLPQATASLQQMEQHITASDQQMGKLLASQMALTAPPTSDIAQGSPGSPPPAPHRPVAAASAKPVAAKPEPAKVETVKPVPVAPVAAPIRTASVAPAQPAPQPKVVEKAPIAKPATKAAKPAVEVAKPAAEVAKPVKQVAKAPAPVNGKGWFVQLGAYGSSTAAQSAWSALAGNVTLEGASPSYSPVNSLTRLQAGPFADKAAARRVCGVLVKSGQSCFTVAP